MMPALINSKKNRLICLPRKEADFFLRETAPGLIPKRGGQLTDKCSSSSEFDGQTKADPDKTYQEDRFIYRHNEPSQNLSRSQRMIIVFRLLL